MAKAFFNLVSIDIHENLNPFAFTFVVHCICLVLVVDDADADFGTTAVLLRLGLRGTL